MIRSALLAIVLAAPAAAQTSAADILAALEKPTTELEQLTAILEGTDEEKALVAMRLMLESGDPAMERLALRVGLTSTSGISRGVALEAYMQGQPTLMAFATGGADASDEFQRWIQSIGSLSSETSGVFPIVIGPSIDDKNCFGAAAGSRNCTSRIAGTEVSFLIGGTWGTASLNESGELVGSISNGSYKTGPVAVKIPLLGQLQ